MLRVGGSEHRVGLLHHLVRGPSYLYSVLCGRRVFNPKNTPRVTLLSQTLQSRIYRPHPLALWTTFLSQRHNKFVGPGRKASPAFF